MGGRVTCWSVVTRPGSSLIQGGAASSLVNRTGEQDGRSALAGDAGTCAAVRPQAEATVTLSDRQLEEIRRALRGAEAAPLVMTNSRRQAT